MCDKTASLHSTFFNFDNLYLYFFLNIEKFNTYIENNNNIYNIEYKYKYKYIGLGKL